MDKSRVFCLGMLVGLMLQEGLAAPGDPAVRAKTAFLETQKRHGGEPRNAEAAWQFARACFDLAGFATNNSQRAEIAEKGISACRESIRRESNSAPAHYYLGMNLGQLAQTRGIGALKIVTEMEREFTTSKELDPSFDYAGPDRNLGLLYREAPSFASIGSRTLARKHLQRAVEMAPGYPENRLNLLETFSGWNDRNGVRRELKALDEEWPRAHTHFSGPDWAASWADWEARLLKVRKKFEEPPKAIESPRQKD